MRILYIDLDCCRADHLGAYGYKRNTSPSIDSIAAEGVTFQHCYCSNSPCLPSRAALFTGRFGFNNGVVTNDAVADGGRREDLLPLWYGHRLDPTKPFLQHHLWSKGLKTVAFSSFHDRHNAWWYAAGWEELHTFTHKKGNESADELNAAFLPWLRQYGREDGWFIHLHYWDIHANYRMPAEWAERFVDSPAPTWPDQETIDRDQWFYGERTASIYSKAGGFIMPAAVRSIADMKQLVDGYDGSIAYADHHIGQVLNTLADLRILDDTAIIVSADHGDCLGELGEYAGHGIASEAVNRIPLIVRWPGITSRSSSDAFVYGLDLGPTLCDLLDLEIPSGWDGTSFASAVRGDPFRGRQYLVLDHGIFTLTRAIRTPRWMLTHILHPGLYPIDEAYWLHDMDVDPYQTRDVAADYPEAVGQLNSHLVDWRHDQLRKGAPLDPLEQKITEGPYLYCRPEQLVATLERQGLHDLVRDLKERTNRFHPGRFAL